PRMQGLRGGAFGVHWAIGIWQLAFSPYESVMVLLAFLARPASRTFTAKNAEGTKKIGALPQRIVAGETPVLRFSCSGQALALRFRLAAKCIGPSLRSG